MVLGSRFLSLSRSVSCEAFSQEWSKNAGRSNFSPGEKFERPAFFDHSWLNASQDALLLSDRNLEPNTIRGLIEMGDWRPVD